MPSLRSRHLRAGKRKAAAEREGGAGRAAAAGEALGAVPQRRRPLVICLRAARCCRCQQDAESLSSLFSTGSSEALPPRCSPRSWKARRPFLCWSKALRKGLFDTGVSPRGTRACAEAEGCR